VEFLSLTYDILMMAGKKERLSLEEVNDVRKMTLLWGRAFIQAGFSMYDWTSYFHVFHEHLFWELLRYSLYQRSSMAVESAIHDAKAVAAKYHVFKRPRRNETRFQAGTRRILEHTWLRFRMEMQRAAKEIPLLPSQCGENIQKFIRLKSVSEGDDVFGLIDQRDQRATSVIQQRKLHILSSATTPVNPLSIAPIHNNETTVQSLCLDPAHAKRVALERLSVVQLKVELKRLGQPLSGNKHALVTRLLQLT
jgi:hypothetical protein